MLSDHIAVEIDDNVKRLTAKIFVSYNADIVTDEDLHGQNVLHYHLFQLPCDRSTSALPPTYAIAQT